MKSNIPFIMSMSYVSLKKSSYLNSYSFLKLVFGGLCMIRVHFFFVWKISCPSKFIEMLILSTFVCKEIFIIKGIYIKIYI